MTIRWTPENKAALRCLWTVHGKSMSEIAGIFGTTKNAISGKIFRMGLVGQGAVAAAPRIRPPELRSPL